MARDGSLNAEGVTLCVELFDRVWVAEAGVGSERSATAVPRANEGYLQADRSLPRNPVHSHFRNHHTPPESIRYAVEETVFLHGMILLHVRGERSESP